MNGRNEGRKEGRIQRSKEGRIKGQKGRGKDKKGGPGGKEEN
jgi:hypothetical protein